ncbi:hypothetical protein [Paenibacillus thermotolerans]|uniref:hypothetical protein n=1 Tax=Paenibacillus thermotolerans TaxID=3027807 RepID=UPI0023677722|nr:MULTISPECIES: hypothetical protein [unclassified Paenibacillus]
MKNKGCLLVVVVVVVILSAAGWVYKQIPKINGFPVSFADIYTPQGNNEFIVHWTAKQNKEAVRTLAQALSNQKDLAPLDQAPADYWFRITLEHTSSPIDMLVWLPSDRPASFVYAFREADGTMGYGGVQASYPISDRNRDKLLQLLSREVSSSER